MVYGFVMTAPTPRPNGPRLAAADATRRHAQAGQFAGVLVVGGSIWSAIVAIAGIVISLQTNTTVDQYGTAVESSNAWAGLITITGAALGWVTIMMLARHVQAVSLDHAARAASNS